MTVSCSFLQLSPALSMLGAGTGLLPTRAVTNETVSLTFRLSFSVTYLIPSRRAEIRELLLTWLDDRSTLGDFTLVTNETGYQGFVSSGTYFVCGLIPKLSQVRRRRAWYAHFITCVTSRVDMTQSCGGGLILVPTHVQAHTFSRLPQSYFWVDEISASSVHGTSWSTVQCKTLTR